MKNRFLSVLIAGILLISSGCGSGIRQLPSSSDTERTARLETNEGNRSFEPSGGGIADPAKIKGYLIGTELPGFADVQAELNRRLKQDLNVQMEINYIGWGEIQSKYPLILAAGDDVDWVFTATWAFYSQLASKGAFLEITPEMLQKYMPGHYSLVCDTSAFKESQINGKSYMITTSTPDRKLPVFIYREDLRKKYGVGEIKRFSDMEPYLRAIRENEPGMVPINLGSNYDLGQPHMALLTEQYDLLQDIIVSTGGGSGIYFKPLDRDGKLYYVTSDPIKPEFIKVSNIMKSWYDKGYINKNAFANRVRSKESFVQARSAVAFGNSFDIQGSITQAIAQGFEVGLVPVVSGKSGHGIADPYVINGIALAASSKNAVATMRAMDLIMEDPAYDALVYYGLEGVNYTVRDDKIVLLNDTSDSRHSYPPDQSGFWFTNKDLLKPLDAWPPSYIDLRSRMKSLLEPNIYAAFCPSTESIKTEVENCNQIVNQYLNPIQLGAFDNADTAFATLEEKLKAANIRKVMADFSTQARKFLEEHR